MGTEGFSSNFMPVAYMVPDNGGTYTQQRSLDLYFEPTPLLRTYLNSSVSDVDLTLLGKDAARALWKTIPQNDSPGSFADSISNQFSSAWEYQPDNSWTYDGTFVYGHASVSGDPITLPNLMDLQLNQPPLFNHFENLGTSSMNPPYLTYPTIDFGYQGPGSSGSNDAQATFQIMGPYNQVNLGFAIPTFHGFQFDGPDNTNLPALDLPMLDGESFVDYIPSPSSVETFLHNENAWNNPVNLFQNYDLANFGDFAPLTSTIATQIMDDDLASKLAARMSDSPVWDAFQSQWTAWGDTVAEQARENDQELDFSNIDNFKSGISEAVGGSSGWSDVQPPHSYPSFEFADGENSTLAEMLSSNFEGALTRGWEQADQLVSVQPTGGPFREWASDASESFGSADHGSYALNSSVGSLLSNLAIDDDVSDTTIG